MIVGMKLGIVTLCIGEFAGPPWIGILNKKEYCSLHGYGFHRYVAPLDRTRSPAWNKIPAIQKHLAEHDWLFWSDADSLIMNQTIRLESFCDDDADVILTRDHNGPSAAHMLLRNTPATHAFLAKLYHQPALAAEPRGEMQALKQLVNSNDTGARVRFVPVESFNSDCAGYRPGHFIIHFAGSTFKPQQMHAFQTHSNISILFRDQFPMLFERLGLSRHGAEVGVNKAEFSLLFERNWPGEMLHLVDCWCNVGPTTNNPYAETDQALEQRYQEVARRFDSNQRVKIHRGLSVDVAGEFTNGFFDWIYIDADHTYESVKSDLNAWFPKVRSGGILAGHDFTDRHYPWGKFGVRTAVTEFIQNMEICLHLTGEADQASWYFVKP